MTINRKIYRAEPPQGIDMPDWGALSIPQFGTVFGLSRSSTYRAIAAGLLCPVKCSGRTLIPVAEAKAFIGRLRKVGGEG